LKIRAEEQRWFRASPTLLSEILVQILGSISSWFQNFKTAQLVAMFDLSQKHWFTLHVRLLVFRLQELIQSLTLVLSLPVDIKA
jgi:hypothetical protein